MKHISLLFIYLAIAQCSFCQSKYKNGVFLELGGSGSLYSINYERQLPHGLIARLGFAYLPQKAVAFPLTFGKVFGKKNHHLEINGGLLLANYAERQIDNTEIRFNTIFGTGFMGYRFQKPDKRMFYRAGFAFLWRSIYREDQRNDQPQSGFIPWAGISIGYRF
jgi:hypothetical protein